MLRPDGGLADFVMLDGCMRLASVARIWMVLPMDCSISGSQWIENRSPIIGSTVENGKRTSSTFPFIHLGRELATMSDRM